MADQAQPSQAALAAFVSTHPPIAGGDDGIPAGAEQGQGEQGQGLYDLSAVEEGVREQLMPHLKAIEGNVTRKFQEAAEYKRGWEPYEQLGVNQMDPQALGSLLDFYETGDLTHLFGDAEQAKQWVSQVADAYGITKAEAQDALEEGLDEGGGFDERAFEERVAQAVEERIGPIQQAVAAQQMQGLEAQEEEALEQRMDELLSEKQLQLSEVDQDRVYKLALAYADEQDPIAPALDEFLQIVSENERGLLSRKLQQPPAPEGPGGGVGQSAEPPKTFADAGKMAVEAMRQQLLAS